MRRVCILWAAMLALAFPALAQTTPDDQAAAPQRRGWRGRGGQGPGPGGDQGLGFGGGRGGFNVQAVAQRLADELALTPEQQTQYDALVADVAEKMRGQGGDRGPMRELAMQYREARRSGDTARAEDIRSQMEAAGGGRRQAFEQFFTDVGAILTDEQKVTLTEFRQKTLDRIQQMRPQPGLRELARTLPDQLDMTEEQRAAYKEMLEEHQAEMAANRDRFREMAPLMRELRDARADGDDARVAELEQQIHAVQDGRETPEEFLDRVAAMLTAAQKAKLAEIRSSFFDDAPPTTGGPAAQEVQAVLRAGRKLKLTTEQRDQFREISRTAAEGRRGKAGNDPAAQAKLAADTETALRAILTSEQVAEFDKLLAAEKKTTTPSDSPAVGGAGGRAKPAAGATGGGGRAGGKGSGRKTDK